MRRNYGGYAVTAKPAAWIARQLERTLAGSLATRSLVRRTGAGLSARGSAAQARARIATSAASEAAWQIVPSAAFPGSSETSAMTPGPAPTSTA